MHKCIFHINFHIQYINTSINVGQWQQWLTCPLPCPLSSIQCSDLNFDIWDWWWHSQHTPVMFTSFPLCSKLSPTVPSLPRLRRKTRMTCLVIMNHLCDCVTVSLSSSHLHHSVVGKDENLPRIFIWSFLLETILMTSYWRHWHVWYKSGNLRPPWNRDYNTFIY